MAIGEGSDVLVEDLLYHYQGAVEDLLYHSQEAW